MTTDVTIVAMILPITSVILMTCPQMQHARILRASELVIANADTMPDKCAARL
jgi:hypothetical protein